jgi:hypothetical protein
MKKFIILIILFISLIIIGGFLYINSDSYKYSIAIEKRNARIAEFDKIPRKYLREGVYNFDCQTIKTKYIKDKFGEYIFSNEYVYLGEGEVSLKSDRIVILFNGIKEVFLLGPPTIYRFGEHDSGYSFPVIQWSAFNTIDNNCFFRFDSIDNQVYRLKSTTGSTTYEPVSIALTVNEFEIDGKINFNGSLLIVGTYAFQIGLGFKSLPNVIKNYESIILSRIKYTYSNEPPDYVNARYQPWVYDLSSFLE